MVNFHNLTYSHTSSVETTQFCKNINTEIAWFFSTQYLTLFFLIKNDYASWSFPSHPPSKPGKKRGLAVHLEGKSKLCRAKEPASSGTCCCHGTVPYQLPAHVQNASWVPLLIYTTNNFEDYLLLTVYKNYSHSIFSFTGQKEQLKLHYKASDKYCCLQVHRKESFKK